MFESTTAATTRTVVTTTTAAISEIQETDAYLKHKVTIEEIQETQPYHNFIESIKSEETKREYTKGLLRYLSYCKKTVEELLSLPEKELKV